MDNVPEFVLTEQEIELLDPLKAFSTLEKALPHFTDLKNPSAGGEVGELIAHFICKRDFGTHHLVKRLAYKMRSRDAVTGFDLTHVRVDENGQIELWMGEAKFYGNRSDAITAALKSLSDHIEEGVLTEKKYLLGPKISTSHPNYDKLQWIFHEDTILDEVIDRMVVPIFIAADTKAINIGHIHEKFSENIQNELDHIMSRISRGANKTLRFVYIYVPLNDKANFDTLFKQKLGAFA